MNVSVIIPAYNAAETLAQALESLCAQTFGEWETIVVDDGSSDETAAIAGRFVAREPRIRVISQPHWGGSVARNTGLRLARFEWLLFLDADDWILPRHLERLTAALQADPALDAVYCGWKRVTSDGALIYEDYGPEEDDLFEVFARRTPFPPLAGLVRRTRVEAAGGFDPSFRTCQDWDFWQRIARAGARFSRVREVLGCYRLQPGSVSTKMPIQFLVDGLRVINQGHSLDSRVPNPLPAYANGRARDDLSGVKLNWVCWPAGLALGRGEDARPLLHTVHEEQYPMLDPYYVAYCIFWAAPVGVYQ
ncbi:MAG: glycosyltransferase family 2 protein, partial [Anaerolineales bacterium]